MFSLTQELPEYIELKNMRHKVKMSFNNILLLFEMLEDKEIPDQDKPLTALFMLIEDADKMVFTEYEEVIDMYVYIMKEFLDIDLKDNKDGEKEVTKKVFDYKKDAKLIYASFLNYYHIDLFEQQNKMHWIKFNALLETLMLLGEDTPFTTVIGYRGTKIPKQTEYNKDDIKRIKAMKKQFNLEEEIEEQEINTDGSSKMFDNGMNALANLFIKGDNQ